MKYSNIFSNTINLVEYGEQCIGTCYEYRLNSLETLPEDLAPSEEYDGRGGGGIFTGSAVNNNGELPLFYTGYAQERQVQCMPRLQMVLHLINMKESSHLDLCLRLKYHVIHLISIVKSNWMMVRSLHLMQATIFIIFEIRSDGKQKNTYRD